MKNLKTISTYSSAQGVAAVNGFDNTLIGGACTCSSSCCG